MKIYALSDVHIDYPQNREWLFALSETDHQRDIMILAGDITHELSLLGEVLAALRGAFRDVVFVPGNHELWVEGVEEREHDCSLEKFHAIRELCASLDVATEPVHYDHLSIVPLFGWYDFSFGQPDRHLRRAWRDFRACRWPSHLQDEAALSAHFLAMNRPHLDVRNDVVISCSHFLPRIDVMPAAIPQRRRHVYPVLGCEGLDEQVAQLASDIHVYGHSHVNQSIQLGATRYVNNAFAYPAELGIARKSLHCVWESSGESNVAAG